MNAAIGSTISSNSAATSADGLQIDDSNVAIVRSTISKKHVPYRGRNFCKLDHATIVQNIVGQSKTRVLSANSSAIDLAITGCCQFPVGQVVQRGFQRIVAFVSGAYEFGAGNTT